MGFVKHFWQVDVLFIMHLLFSFILNANLLFKLIYDTYQIYLKKTTHCWKINNTVFVFILVMVSSTGKDSRKAKINMSISTMRSSHIRCNATSLPRGGASAQRVHWAAYLRQPVVFLSTRDEWNFSLWSSSKVELLHPEWGMITVLVRVVKASRMIVIFTASQDDRFHSTPAETRACKHPVTSAVKSS